MSSSSSMNDDAKDMPAANDDANNNNNNMMMRMDSHDEIERNRSLRQDDDEVVVLHDSTLYTQNNVTDNESSSLWNNQEEDMVASTAALFLTLTHNNNSKEEELVDTENSMLVLHNKDDSCCVGKTSLRERLQKSLLADRRQSPQHTRETESSENDDSSSCWTGEDEEDGSNSSGILLSDPKEDISAEEDPKTHVDSFTNPAKDTICQAYAQYAASAETLETTKPKTNLVKLHIYDLIASETVMQVPWVGCHFPIGKCFSAVNNGLHALGTGAYHCGIEVNGIEYAFGANEVEGLSGVFTCIPKHSPGYEYRTTLDFGHLQTMKRTWIKVPKVEIVEIPLEQEQPQEEQDNNETPPPPAAIEVHASSVYRQHATFCHGHAVMRQMAREYMGRHYDLLTKNCCTFARDACLRLGVSQDDIPTWFLNLAETGRVTKKMAENSFKPFSSCQEQAATAHTEPSSSRKSLALAAVEMPCMDRGFEVVGNDMEELRVIDVDHGSPAWRQRL